MASAGARANIGVLGAEPQRECRGQSPLEGASPSEADEVFVFKTVIFNGFAAAVLHKMMYNLYF